MTEGRTGRPKKRGRRRETIILAALEAGNSYRAAAGLAGIHEDSLHNWLKDSSAFSAKVADARAKAEADAVERMKEDPKGWAFQLERQYGWIEKKRVDVNVEAVRIDVGYSLAPETAGGVEKEDEA